ncbi:UNVERIFIED_CONTAM: hypothetical protein PYX00_003146 [Menopon gallinae]|uniref:Uncharacterized protein n=1 Tax=Menopon gallinae TaxID=328185 RepID=A0AAW2HZ69_9NEOP
MLAEVSWILALPASIFGIIGLTLTVAICLCGCRGKQHKDELGGIEGHVKITNPEDLLQEVNANNNVHNEITVADKPQNTAKRSLPDLPVDQNTNGGGDGNWEANGDATSDLYATVVLQDEKNKKHARQKSESDSLSASYAHLKEEHPYDRLKKVEHPYAQVKDHGPNQPSASVFHESKSNENETDDQGVESEPITPERPRRESSGNIPAATAIAGHVTASDDLPYITAPAHFSGDSQDSGKGYTSISVREPLSAIRAETKQSSSRRADPHYATVSDDSDDMYAAIDDPSQVYTSESETYAQIQSGNNKPNPAPQPPSVNSLKQMAVTSQSHSRQASSSSAASSTAVSSPKPEKRPANSPLPPPPAATTPDSIEDLYAFVDKKLEGSPRNLEDMYAKVNKKGRRDVEATFERGASTESGASESSDSMSYKMQTNSLLTSTTTPSTDASRSCHSYKSTTETSSPSTSRQDKTGSSFSLETDLHPSYEKLDFDGNRSDPGYETVNGPHSDSLPNYEQLKPQEHDYASIARTRNVRIDRHESDISDGYARVQSNAGIYSKIDHSEADGYARVEPKEDADDGYAKVLKCNNNRLESNYERVLFDERVQSKHSDPVGEPTYESLGNEFDADDPNYESVHYLISSAPAEPPYQLLKDCESGAAAAKK